MIARIWHGRTPREKADSYVEYLEKTGVRDQTAIEGNSERLRAYAAKHGYEYHQISAVVGDGVRDLIRLLARFVRENAERDGALASTRG